MAAPKPRTITAEASAALAALDGTTVTVKETEYIHDPVLHPEVDPIPWETTTAEHFTVPRRFLPATCPECDGPRCAPARDALDFNHEERCDLGAALAATLRRDAAVIARRVGRGEPAQRSRVSTVQERLCLAERGVTPPSHCTTVRLNSQGEPVRSWYRLGHEPDLATS